MHANLSAVLDRYDLSPARFGAANIDALARILRSDALRPWRRAVTSRACRVGLLPHALAVRAAALDAQEAVR